MHRSTDEDAGGREQRDRGREVRNGAAIPVSIGKTDYPAAEILEELRKITQSPQFRHCTRGKQFLDYVVREKLLGRTENLKERSIGVAVFRRAAVYATGDDPVVRVQAREVRRRLDQYYRDRSNSGSIRIDLPTGSYVPEFLRPNTTPQEVPAPGQPGTPASSPPTPFAGGGPVVPRNWWKAGFFSLVVVVIVASAVSLLVRTTGSGSVAGERGAPAQPVNSNNAVNRFWAPVLGTSQPVMIYLAKGVSYRPSADIYQSYAKSHHGAFSLQVQQANQPLPLSPDTKLEWKQMILYTDFGVAVGDVNVAVRLATLFGGMNKPEQLRIGKNFSYADLSSAPTVLVGAFNDKWTMDLTSQLPFALVDKGGAHLSIQEQVPPGRSWPWPQVSETHRDYGLVTRLVSSKTGQFTVIVAGCSGPGTEAAGNLVTSDRDLGTVLRGLPNGWQNRNLQLLIETRVVDGAPEPATILAYHVW